MRKKDLALIAIEQLKIDFPEAICSLEYTHPYELLIATRLSAQCTDARVNIVTRVLFKEYPTIEAIAEAPLEEIEKILRPCGLYKVKSKDTKNMCIRLIEDYNSILPNSIEELTKLPGIGRKTANLIMGDIFGEPAYVCDTHCIRITNHLGITTGTDPLKVEMQLRKILPPEEANDFCHRMVLFGRETCTARSPKCHDCTLNHVCKDGIKTINKAAKVKK